MTSLTSHPESRPATSLWMLAPSAPSSLFPSSAPAESAALPTGGCFRDTDALMQAPHSRFGSVLNRGLGWALAQGGYDASRRGRPCDGNAAGSAAGDNSFYRDQARWMPGWGNTLGLGGLDPKGLASGAWAQDRATNHVGHHDPEGIWAGVRTGLVTQERAAIARAQGQGKDHISFSDVYRSHVAAYAGAQQQARTTSQGSSGFIDPASFALAVYGAPLLEHAGIDTGPLTGASIDLFNDPTDRVEQGWAKRMALSAAEVGTGAALMLGPSVTGGVGLGQRFGGAALMGAGVFGGMWNTGSAIANGMTLKGAASGLGHVAGSTAKLLGHAGAELGHHAWDGAAQLGQRAVHEKNALGQRLLHGATAAEHTLSGAVHSLWAN